MRVVVIGAGVLGAAVSYELQHKGADVVLLEAGAPGTGTSRTTFAMDVTARKTPRTYFDLNMRAGARHAELAAEMGDATATGSWVHPAPSVEIDESSDDRQVVAERLRRTRSWGYRGEMVPLRELSAQLRGLDLTAVDADSAVVYPDAAWYDPSAFIASMLEFGAPELRTDTRVTALRPRGDDGWTVGTSSGSWSADWVVNCAGAGAGDIAELAGVELPLTRVPGIIAETGPIEGELPAAIVTLWSINFRPTPAGALCLHSYSLDTRAANGTAASAADLDEYAAELRRMAARLVPALRRPHVPGVVARIGVRPVPTDGLPLIGAHPSAPRLYHVATHSGVHLAPAIAELVAGDITGTAPNTIPQDYRVDRNIRAAADESMREMVRTYDAEKGRQVQGQNRRFLPKE